MNTNKLKHPHLIHHWGKILIDTNVLIKVLGYRKTGREDFKFYYDLLAHLASTQYQKSNGTTADRSFFISAISIAEILERVEEGSKKSQNIIHALNANNVTVVDFDEDVADLFNTEFCEVIGKQKMNDLLSKWGESVTKGERESLTKDIMILASGMFMEMDACLCYDKGLYRIGRECGVNTIYCLPEFFRNSGDTFFEFYAANCDKALNTIPKSNGETSGGLFDVAVT